MPVAADHPDGPSCQLDVDGLPAEDSSRRSVLAVPPPGQKPTADEESEGDEQRQEEEENDGDERVDLSTAERVRRNEAALAHITDGHRQHIGALEQPSRHEAESGHHSPGQHRQGEEREHRQARDAHEDRRGGANEGGTGPSEDEGERGDTCTADQQAHSAESFESR